MCALCVRVCGVLCLDVEEYVVAAHEDQLQSLQCGSLGAVDHL